MQATIRDIEIYYELTGSGRRFVWGHGLTSSRADEMVPPVLIDWDRISTQFEVLRYDARGHGQSEYSSDPAGYDWQELARDQLALVDRLGMERFALGGASMGAATALHTAVLAPERVTALVLVIPPTAWETRAEQTDVYRQMADIVETRGVELLVAGGASVPPPDPFVDQLDYADRRAARLRAADPVRLAGVFRGAATTDLPTRDQVSAIDVPTLILAWTGDPAHPVSSAQALGDLIPGAEVSLASTMAELRTWTDRTARFLRR